LLSLTRTPPLTTLFPYTTLFRSRKVVFANQAFGDLFGLSTDSIVGKHRDELVREAAQLSSDPEDFVRRLSTVESGAYALRAEFEDRKSTRLNSSHVAISYAVFCL